MMILEDVIEEHAEEAAFLWQQREMAVRAPDFDIFEIMEADERVEAHLDGLRIAGEVGWEVTHEIGFDDGGEFFTGMWLAVEHGNTQWIKEIMEAAEGNAEASRGVISAFGWTNTRKLQGLVSQLLKTSNPYGRQIGIGACAIHRVNPGGVLDAAMTDPHAGVRARALKAAGELGLTQHLGSVEANLQHDDDECRFWAAWSAGLLGSQNALEILSLFAAADNPRRRQALELAVRLMEPERAHQWVRSMVADRDNLRWALIASGHQGDPMYLEPLMKQFSNEEVARVAGESFEMITGLNIFRESLEIIPPVEQAPEPSEEELEGEWVDDEDDDDDDEDLGEDEGLVIPDPEKMHPWFEENKDRFPAGERLLCGHPITTESCSFVLLNGQQRQRRAAAQEMVLASPGTPLFETRAPGQKQMAQLTGRSGS